MGGCRLASLAIKSLKSDLEPFSQMTDSGGLSSWFLASDDEIAVAPPPDEAAVVQLGGSNAACAPASK